MPHRSQPRNPSTPGADSTRPTSELDPSRSDTGHRSLTTDLGADNGVLKQRVIDVMHDTSLRIRALEAVRGVTSDVAENAVDAVLRDWLVTHRTNLKRLARALIAIESGVRGRCGACGNEIEIPTLVNDPVTDRCGRCSTPDIGISRP